MDVREIENIIDHVHDNHPVFKQEKKQVVFELLSTFEDICSLAVMSSMLNPLALRNIVDQMDALNMALQWANNLAQQDTKENIDTNISELRYNQCTSLITEYAYPYSVICSGYISFSRKRLSASVDGNNVTFNFEVNQNSTAWSDILREASGSSFDSFVGNINPSQIAQANYILQQNIKIEDGMLCYSLSDSIIKPFKEIATQHWNATKTLPETWAFDLFSLEEYKEFWISLAILCYIHFFGCLTIQDALVRIKNATIIQSRESIVNYIVSMSRLEKEKVEAIIRYITYSPEKKNVDIMYQPIVDIGNNKIIIAPMLIMGSQPERNLLAVVSSKRDDNYSKEVNDLEDLMVCDLESVIIENDNVQIVKHRNLVGRLPDIDFAVLDKTTRSAMICELKWFAAADSAKEVYAKEDEITHGCEQVESIISYFMSYKGRFFKQIFDEEDGENIDLFCCVIAKHNIRTQNKYVPVIDLKRIKELLSEHSLNSVFHMVRNHEFETPLPDDATITHQEINYGGFVFKIPAICFESFDI